MLEIREIMTNYHIEITLFLLISILALFISLIIIQLRYKKLRKNYEKVVRGVRGVDIGKLLININEEITNINNGMYKAEKRVDEINTRLCFAIQKVGFVRYNAFREMGSELSFSMALLDEFKNGFIYSSIYGRESTVSYGKPIKDGTSKIPLSAEEMLALDRAIKGETL